MARLIDADKLEKEMYHEAFETDSDLQKWDSGCWIRYRMFKDCIVKQPTIDAVEVVRCKDCKHKDIRYYDKQSAYCYKLNRNTHVNDYCCWGAKMDGGDK